MKTCIRSMRELWGFVFSFNEASVILNKRASFSYARKVLLKFWLNYWWERLERGSSARCHLRFNGSCVHLDLLYTAHACLKKKNCYNL